MAQPSLDFFVKVKCEENEWEGKMQWKLPTANIATNSAAVKYVSLDCHFPGKRNKQQVSPKNKIICSLIFCIFNIKFDKYLFPH